MNESRKPPFTVVDGGKEELERKKYLLFNQPWVFDHDEFDQLCESFQLPRAEAFDLALTRVEHKAKTNYEAAAVLAVFSGSGNASDILARGRRKNFRLETSELQVPLRSSAPGDADPS
ncbi:hypothetical protein [Burkholderia multivorans]|uniref:hypothetical protein n=1 Tax=Burkholderia multivorans TaxID=87883 RepID=UPI0028708785|nr:hypothetical protein [Burkholderia multivorans]